MVKLIVPTQSRVICVIESSSATLIERGWITAADTEPSVAEIYDTVKTISVTKVTGIGVKKSTTAVYDYVFEVCAGGVTLAAPEVIVKSDMETKKIVLANDVVSNSCNREIISIIAIDQASIRAELAKQDDIVSKIASIKEEIDTLTQQIEVEKTSLAALLVQQNSDEKRQQLNEAIAKISTLRQSLTDLKDDINRYYYILYGGAQQKAQTLPKKSFTGTEITGDSVKIMSVTPTRTEGKFDIVMEICAGSKTISDPVVEISSGDKQNTLKLNKVTANSCYKTGAKIEATDSQNIFVKFAEVVSETSTLKDILWTLETRLSQKRADLADLTQKSTNPDPQQIHQLTQEISSLREQVVTTKALLYQNLYKLYKTN